VTVRFVPHAADKLGKGRTASGAETAVEVARTPQPEIVNHKKEDGGRDRDRTCDPLDVNEVLSR
jgi:hypothetical protein